MPVPICSSARQNYKERFAERSGAPAGVGGNHERWFTSPLWSLLLELPGAD